MALIPFRRTAFEVTRFSNQVGAPLEAILWKPIPIIPSEPLELKIELVTLARAKVWFSTDRPATVTTSVANRPEVAPVPYLTSQAVSLWMTLQTRTSTLTTCNNMIRRGLHTLKTWRRQSWYEKSFLSGPIRRRSQCRM